MTKPAPTTGILISLFWLLIGLAFLPEAAHAATFTITNASWSGEHNRLYVAGNGTAGDSVTIANADTGATLGTTTVSNSSSWSARFSNLTAVPCRVRATQSNGNVAEAFVSNAPSSCTPPQLSINNVTVNEGQTANFTVRLSTVSNRTITVVAATADGTAHAGTNYTAKTATLTFPAGTTTQTFSVSTLDDHAVTNTLTFYVNLSSPSNATISDGQGVGSILNIDQPALTINNVSVNEGQTANFTVRLSAASTHTITVVAATADNTAHAGTNYVAKTATLTFAPGTTTQTFSVSTIDDHVVTGTLSFYVNLTSPTNATISDSQGVGSIQNIDQAATASLSINDVTVNEGQTANFTVTLSAASTLTVTVVAATADNTAHAGTNYVAKTATLTFAPGVTTQTFSVSTIDDHVATGTLSFYVNLTSPSNATISDSRGVGSIQNIDQAAQPGLSINDVSVTEGQTANFTVSLSAASTQTVTVVASTANNTAVAGTDYVARTATLSFAPGTTSQSFSVTTLNDNAPGSAKTFYVNLTSPTNATISDTQGVGTVNEISGGGTGGSTSINSTSQNSPTVPSTSVPLQALVTNSGYQVFAINDLGMHCGDLDPRILSILPPFNILHAQVVKKGANTSTGTTMLDQTQVTMVYSASANPKDPVLSNPNSVLDTNFTGVYKTLFWDIVRGAYAAFYPAGVEAQFFPDNANILDLGLPVPDLERLYLGDGQLAATQQKMPGINAAYTANDTQPFSLFTGTEPYFSNFAYGYNAVVHWFEAAGIPLTAFDDAGRENAYPLMRVQAVATSSNTLGVSAGTVLGTLDAVTPISGEANCAGCHGAVVDGGNGSGTAELSATEVSVNDPQFGKVPLPVSVEWASDKDILRLHDLKHGTHLIAGTTEDFPTPGPTTFKPVVCQTCHYTPALDLAQVGPQNSNGLQQLNNKTMSNVIHGFHANLTFNGQTLFPAMPPPAGRDPATAQQVLGETCYQCHPGKRTQCLRGAMGQSGVVCQDCHGNMAQVGNDYSRTQPGGTFQAASDFYTNPNTPRVPWVNEPSCGSCHTGDAMSNMTATANVYPASDGIRLLQAWHIGDAKATPIVPTNKRFAEPVVAATGSPMLFKLSTGHGGLLCESCHGSTHAIWATSPMNPAANDNVAPTQVQGHAGAIMECSACHTGTLANNLNGPHGMHPVASSSWISGHENFAGNGDPCRVCHGVTGQGTPLSMVPVARTVGSRQFAAGEQVSCGKCHTNYIASGTGINN
ncbi:MAG TPA: Calx-beta domain-containing protein [Parasulfuritortus sp.]